MTTEKRYMQPGFLVVGNIQQKGCTSYRISDRETTRADEEGFSEEWRTAKNVKNAEEQRAVAAKRAELSRRIAALGTYVNGFGFLVPKERETELEETLRLVRAEISVYNEAAAYTRLDGYFATFIVSGEDTAVAGALYSRAVSLVERMAKAISQGDVKTLRAACAEVGNLPAMLPADSGEELSAEVKRLREEARRAVRAAKEAVEKGLKGEEVEAKILRGISVDGLRMGLIERASEVDRAAQVAKLIPTADPRAVEIQPASPPEEPAADVQARKEFRQLETGPAMAPRAAQKPNRRQIDLF